MPAVVAAVSSSPRHVLHPERQITKRLVQLQRINRSGGELARRRRFPVPIAAGGDSFDDDDDDQDAATTADAPDFGKFAWDPVAEPRDPPSPPPPFTTASPHPPFGGSPASFPSTSDGNNGGENKTPPSSSLADDLKEVRLLAAAAAAGLASAARAVSRAFKLLLSFFPGVRPQETESSLSGGKVGSGLGAVAVLPQPREVLRLTVAVVAASLALLAVVLLCDEVGRRLITETLVAAKK